MNHKIKKYINTKLSDKKWQPSRVPPKSKYDTIITIPCYNEYDYIFKTLDSVNQQDPALLQNTVVSIVINNSEDANDSIVLNNRKTYEKLLKTTYKFDFIVIDAFSNNKALESKFSGAGMARKISVDSMLNYLEEDSLICFIDADTILSDRYLTSIKSSYRDNRWQALLVNFSHQNDEPKTKVIIREYEKYLKETAKNIRDCGSPYGYVSLGSTMVCTYLAYISIGGMNRKIASEDFYFLQELEKYCGVKQINDILVYPSSRYASRLYLGTSVRLQKTLNGELDISTLYFSDDAYSILSAWIQLALSSEERTYSELKDHIISINSSLIDFLNTINLKAAWGSIIEAPSSEHFVKQFHRWFDGLNIFKLLKFYTNS
tara:strand:+ start:3307 stop:4431 length:1125 start_codon:yes stop_codon:yes gene_type:complete